MALGPDSLRDVAKEDRANADIIEAEIDKALLTVDPAPVISITIRDCNKRVQGELALRYIKAGWLTVEFETHSNRSNEFYLNIKLEQ